MKTTPLRFPGPLARRNSVGRRGAFRRDIVAVLAAGVCLVVVQPSTARSQSIRVNGVTTIQAVDLRPLVEDSVDIALAIGDGPYRTLGNGQIVRCVEGLPFCRYRRSGSRVMATPLVQDLRASAWGLGQGISLQAHVRARSSLGREDFLWPRAQDEFDAIEAYVQVDRRRMRARLGRQWTVNGLGAYNFDGGSLLYIRERWRAEAFGGVSLVEGLNEAHDGGLLGEIDDLPPDERGYLVGIRGSSRLGANGVLSGTYQRIIRSDRASLYAERVAADFSTRLLGAGVDAGWVHDLVSGDVNEARLRVSRQLPMRFAGSVDLRRHRPYFESWTIWGVFSPVAFDEARGTLAWRDPSGRLSLDARGGWRKYGKANAGVDFLPLRDDGWRVGAGGEWAMTDAWFLYGEYDVDVGFGASRSDAAAGARWAPDEDRYLGATVTSMENVFEFRLGTGKVLGLRLEGGTQLSKDARVVVDGAVYSHRLSDNATGTDWSQRRFSVRLEWTMGRDPGQGNVPPARRTP